MLHSRADVMFKTEPGAVKGRNWSDLLKKKVVGTLVEPLASLVIKIHSVTKPLPLRGYPQHSESHLSLLVSHL